MWILIAFSLAVIVYGTSAILRQRTTPRHLEQRRPEPLPTPSSTPDPDDMPTISLKPTRQIPPLIGPVTITLRFPGTDADDAADKLSSAADILRARGEITIRVS